MGYHTGGNGKTLPPIPISFDSLNFFSLSRKGRGKKRSEIMRVGIKAGSRSGYISGLFLLVALLPLLFFVRALLLLPLLFFNISTHFTLLLLYYGLNACLWRSHAHH